MKLHHAVWAGIAERMGLFDVFGSWWFTGIYVLLLVSVAGCLVPRYRAFARALRARPKMSATLNDHSAYRHAFVRNTPAEVLDISSRTLRRRRFRIARNDSWLAAERGLWREGESLVFHSAFYLLIVGIFLARSGNGSDATRCLEAAAT